MTEFRATDASDSSREPDVVDWRDIELVPAVNWNNVDPFDKEIWDRLTGNFWLPEKISLTGDLPSWSTLTADEQRSVSEVFAGLTLLDTIQARVGALSLIPDARTQHEEDIYIQIAHMESVHAKSYSSIFSTLLSTDEINDIFRWSSENEYLRKKAAIVLNYYRGDDPEKRKIASTLLESFLFYSGFFMPLWWASKGKLVATADIITLILRDESVHGAYIGAKFGQAYREADDARQWELESFANDLFWELYENELHYTEMIYDPMGITEHVKTFLRYNAVKAFQNLGLEEPDFGDENMEVLPQILAALDPGGNANHDFFSSTSSSYVFGSAVGADIGEDDWESMFED